MLPCILACNQGSTPTQEKTLEFLTNHSPSMQLPGPEVLQSETTTIQLSIAPTTTSFRTQLWRGSFLTELKLLVLSISLVQVAKYPARTPLERSLLPPVLFIHPKSSSYLGLVPVVCLSHLIFQLCRTCPGLDLTCRTRRLSHLCIAVSI